MLLDRRELLGGIVSLAGVGFDCEDYAEEWDYEPPIAEPEGWELDALLEDLPQLYNLTPSQFVEQAILVTHPVNRSWVPFSFEQRPYLRRIYDTKSKRILLVAGRQVEKCEPETTLLSGANGCLTQLKDVRVGDELSCLETFEQEWWEDAPGNRTTTSKVTWTSDRFKKPCIRLKTRQGHVLDLATTHPVRVWGGWKDASDLHVGDKIAVVRRAGAFTDRSMPESRIQITAFMIGDGCCDHRQLAFTNASMALLEAFEGALDTEQMGYTFQKKAESKAITFVLPQYKAQKVHDWLAEDGLLDTDSYTKFVPPWVFDLPKEQTALFLNRLWSTDGHVKQNHDTKWSIEYCSMSRRLILDVQALLWKFGIPSCIRENWPNIYKKRGEHVVAYILRVETQEGIRAFVRDIGALDKIERQELDSWSSNPHTDTYPPEVTALVHDIYNSVGPARGDRTLTSEGIERLPRKKYCLTARKLQELVTFFRGDQRYAQEKVDILEAHLSSDIMWDDIEQLEDIGEQWCRDLTVADHHNFISAGVVTHNSTLLSNKTFAMSCIIPGFKTLYVSPSSTQTKEFSKSRLKETMETSPVIKTWFPESLTDNIYEKKGINRSEIKLRYAFLNADRCRGIATDNILLDEFQDLLLDNIPVIEEAASHSPFRIFTYAGTPKSLDNPIQYYWDTYSTQNEWAVPCERHGTAKAPGSWHWNILGEQNIGNYLMCDKCGGEISAAHPNAQWVQTGRPDPKYDQFEGFRIPQLMVPWIEWKEILTKQKKYPRGQFYNEVLGLSFDSGQRPLTRADIADNCDPRMALNADYLKEIQARLLNSKVYAGIDWGQDSTNSYTVISLGAYLDGFFRIFFVYRFEGKEADTKAQMDKIKRILSTFRVQRVGADHGGGLWPNRELLRAYGTQRILQYQYSTPNTYVKWDSKLGRFLIHRSEVMSAFFNAIKRKDVFRFPRWTDFATPFASDMLAVFSEYNERTRTTDFKKSPNTTDDTLHSILLCFLASMIDNPRPEILVPSATIDSKYMVNS